MCHEKWGLFLGALRRGHCARGSICRDTPSSAQQLDNIGSFNPAKYLRTRQQQEAAEVWKKEIASSHTIHEITAFFLGDRGTTSISLAELEEEPLGNRA